VFFRLPLGTGNDAADCRDWATALRILGGRELHGGVASLSMLEVQIPGQAVHFAFNIASLGLDAFVSDLTNKLKIWFPGNSYGLMVDLATLFYERFVQVVPTKLELTKGGQPTLSWTEGFLLAAMGATGHRTYGAGKRILPDTDNYCLAGRQNLLEKLGLRTPFYQGTHRGRPRIHFAAGDTLRVISPVRLPLQMDGEVMWLEPSDFPLTITIVDRGINVLSLAGSATHP
jgi:diacylglycerol kinase family enzyme